MVTTVAYNKQLLLLKVKQLQPSHKIILLIPLSVSANKTIVKQIEFWYSWYAATVKNI